MKKVNVIIERGSDGLYSVFMDCYDFNFGLSGFGNSVEEAKVDFMECYNELREMKGEAAPELTFEFKYDTASFLQAFSKKLSLTGLQAITGINRKQLNHYVTGHRRPSEATVKKISEGIKKFQEELKHVSFI